MPFEGGKGRFRIRRVSIIRGPILLINLYYFGLLLVHLQGICALVLAYGKAKECYYVKKSFAEKKQDERRTWYVNGEVRNC